MTQSSGDLGPPAGDGDPLLALEPWMLEAAFGAGPPGRAVSVPADGGLRLAYETAGEALAAAGRHRADQAAARRRLQELRAEDAALTVRERRLQSEAGTAPRWQFRKRAALREQVAVTRAERREVSARMTEWEAEEHDSAARAGNAELVGRLLAEPGRAMPPSRALRLGEWAAGWLAGVITRSSLASRAAGRDSTLRLDAAIPRSRPQSLPALPPPAYEHRGPEARP